MFRGIRAHGRPRLARARIHASTAVPAVKARAPRDPGAAHPGVAVDERYVYDAVCRQPHRLWGRPRAGHYSLRLPKLGIRGTALSIECSQARRGESAGHRMHRHWLSYGRDCWA